MSGSLVVESRLETSGAGGYQQVGTVSPPAQEAAKVFAAKFVALAVVQLSPLPVLVPDHRQAAVSHNAVPSLFELEAVVDVQVPVEPESLVHQADGAYRVPAKCHAIGLHRVRLTLLHLFVEMLHVIGGKAVWTEDADRLVGKLLRDGPQNVAGYLGGSVQNHYVLATA